MSFTTINLDLLDDASLHDLKHAAMRYGTFFITGTDVEAALRLAPYDQTLDFFHQPLTYKQQWRSVQPGILNGFHMSGGFSFGKEKEGKQDGTSDLRQFYVAPPSHPLPLGMTEYTQVTAPRVYPNPSFATAMEAYYNAIKPLHMRVMAALARCIQVEEADFCQIAEQYTAFLVANYYPNTPSKGSNMMGIGAHQDGGLVTILNPEENKQGLEIEVDGQWLPVTPRPGTLVVNLGVAMHKLTNGLFNAIRHRVVNIGERQSFASFLHCDFDAVLQPLPALVEAGTQPISAPELGAEHYVGFFRAAIPADKQTYGHLLAWQATLQQARATAASRNQLSVASAMPLGRRCSDLLPRDAVAEVAPVAPV